MNAKAVGWASVLVNLHLTCIGEKSLRTFIHFLPRLHILLWLAYAENVLKPEMINTPNYWVHIQVLAALMQSGNLCFAPLAFLEPPHFFSLCEMVGVICPRRSEPQLTHHSLPSIWIHFRPRCLDKIGHRATVKMSSDSLPLFITPHVGRI